MHDLLANSLKSAPWIHKTSSSIHIYLDTAFDFESAQIAIEDGGAVFIIQLTAEFFPSIWQ